MEHFFRHFFTPHHTNNHRAKALHHDSLLFYLLILAVFNFGIRVAHRQFPAVLGYATDIRLEQLLQSTNKVRIGRGLSELQLNSILSEAAAKKAQDMFANGYWAHTSPTGKTPWEFITGSGYVYSIAGENLAKNFMTSQGVVDAWMASPTHKDNLVKPGYKDVGFAIVNGVLNGEETTLVVQMFGAPEGGIAMTPNSVKPVEVVTVNAEALNTNEKTGQTLSMNAFPQVISNMFSSVTEHPLMNIPTITRDIVFLFIGFLIAILIIDGVVVAKKRTVRVTGHTVAHVLFLLGMAIAILTIQRGVIV